MVFSIFFNGRKIIKLRPPHPPIEWFALVSAILLLEWQLLTIKRNAESVHKYSGWRTAVARWHRARHSTKNDRSNKVAMCIAFALCGSASAQRSDGTCEYGVGRTAVDGGQRDQRGIKSPFIYNYISSLSCCARNQQAGLDHCTMCRTHIYHKTSPNPRFLRAVSMWHVSSTFGLETTLPNCWGLDLRIDSRRSISPSETLPNSFAGL